MQETEMMQMTIFNHRENIIKYPENIVKISWVMKRSWKYQLFSQMTEMMQPEYRENIVKLAWKCRQVVDQTKFCFASVLYNRERSRKRDICRKSDSWAILSCVSWLRISIVFCIMWKWCYWAEMIRFVRIVKNVKCSAFHSKCTPK